MRAIILRSSAAVLLLVLGLFLLRSAAWITATTILPQARQTGWSISGSSMILNHVWEGNAIYVPVLLYAAAGAVAVLLALRLWRRPPATRRGSREA